jgi:transcriptional regulator with GAF, ATPase, and Fis domain
LTFWDFLCGKLDKITVHYEVLPIPSDLIGDYGHDKEFRRQFQQWLNQRWQLKDEKIQSLINVPMMLAGNVAGLIGFDSVVQEKEWPQDSQALLKTLDQLRAAREVCRSVTRTDSCSI